MIEMIVGPMFAGKTSELLSEIEQCKVPFQVFKPSEDTRSGAEIVSHDGRRVQAEVISNAVQIIEKLKPGTRAVFIDEVQFFSCVIASICRELEDMGIRVVCAGLDMDYRREQFPCVGPLLVFAGKVTKLKAWCAVCGKPAQYSWRFNPDDKDEVSIGGADKYEPRCLNCWEKGHA